MKEKYLPIGTVVLLKEATKRLMITGYCSSQPTTPDIIYDYVACLFPEGNLAGDDVALFNHDQIGSVSHMGLADDEYVELDKQIKAAMAGEENVFASAAQTAQQAVPQQNNANLDHIDFNNLAPFTPENINLMLSEIHKHGDEFKPIAEPTAFDEEVIKKPAFELPSLGGDDDEEKEEDKKKQEKEIEEDDYEEEEVREEVKETVADGQPVLQLQPIFDNQASADTTPSEPAAPAAPLGGGFSGLSRL